MGSSFQTDDMIGNSRPSLSLRRQKTTLAFKTSTLASRIHKERAESKYGDEKKEDYLPEGSLDELLTEETIKEALSKREKLELTDHEEQQLVEHIARDLKKVFAISLLADVAEGDQLCIAMYQFKDFSVTDSQLPITSGLSHMVFNPEVWGTLKAKSFCDKQWMLLVPVFTKKQLSYEIKRQSILPFQGVEGLHSKNGTFGKVYAVKIHHAHDKAQDKPGIVAVKEIIAQDTAHANQNIDNVNDIRRQWWATEAAALGKLSNIRHENLIECIAAISREGKYYFLFPWANGGSLRDFWATMSQPKLNRVFVRKMLEQMCGLAGALHMLHDYRDLSDTESSETSEGGGIRHGDLKPENILRFTARDAGCDDIGTLKIADMGLAKHHEVVTTLRMNPTATRHGTARYEPPEAGGLTGPTSRLYDMWSMGCILLELIIWVMQGSERLDDLINEIQKGQNNLEPRYYLVHSRPGLGRVTELHPSVTLYMEKLAKYPLCGPNTALGDLIKVIRKKLLVVELPQGGAAPQNGTVTVTPAEPSETSQNESSCRASAKILFESLTDILGKSKTDDNYLLPDAAPFPLHIEPAESTSTTQTGGGLHPNSALGRVPVPRGGSIAMGSWPTAGDSPRRENLDIKVWEYQADNNLAKEYLDALSNLSQASPFPATPPDELCNDCKNLDFWTPQFHINDKLLQLKENAKACRFCKMRWDASSNLESKTDRVRFDRVGSVIKMNESDPPVFSICRHKDSQVPESIQIGLPVVTDAGSPSHFALIRRWLDDCDNNHGPYKCNWQPPTDDAAISDKSINITDSDLHDLELAAFRAIQSRKSGLPTRLIDVDTTDSPTIRLLETKPDDEDGRTAFRYIALSHRWGRPTPSKPAFCTTMHNRTAHMSGIEMGTLPPTFRDAVIVTRALGVRYLWIDSICIIQGEGGDFGSESKRMEAVFSGAYCVIASTCAEGQWDGFLGRTRPPRNYVEYPPTRGLNGGSPFYVCQYIDDFNGEVLEADMNKRGWVLQERALARRTIYFADRQSYFECGGGVRCETLTKMSNQLAAVLGDPNFPNVAIISRSSTSSRETSRGEKILYFQDLYRTYSRLAFTVWADRAVALEGLEQRLRRGFKARGGLGILDDGKNGSLLYRSLLWHRGADQPSLAKIRFPAERQRPPSWSWMAYRGGIDYFDIPFDGVEWSSGPCGADVRSPWQPAAARTTDSGQQRDEVAELSATARTLTEAQGRVGDDEDKTVRIVHDVSGMTDAFVSGAMCVILGRAKGRGPVQDRAHYVLLVAPRTRRMGARTAKVYERIGAGRIPGRLIDLKGPGLDIKIQ